MAHNVTKFQKNNKSGHIGVFYDNSTNKWRAQIKYNKKYYKLGQYKTIEESIFARQIAEYKFYGIVLDPNLNEHEKELLVIKIKEYNEKNNNILSSIKERDSLIYEKGSKNMLKTCKNCGKEFEGYKTARYCSEECKHEFKINNNNNIEKQENNIFGKRNLSNSLSKNNKSGYRGVYFDNTKQKWRSQIRFNKKCHKLGLYENKLDAVKARQKAELEYYGKILELDSSEEVEYNQIEDYVSNMTDAGLIKICNDLYDFVNNDFYILYKQLEDNISSIDELKNMFLEESNKRFYKLNKINRMLNNDIE
jgi:hypothetical protein